MKEQMRRKILYIIGTLDLGGAETHLTQIAPKLQGKYDVSVCVIFHRGVLASDLEKNSVPVIGPLVHSRKLIDKFKNSRLRYFFIAVQALQIKLKIIRLIFKLKPDVIHYYLPWAYMLGGLAASCLGHKTQVMSRRSLNYYQRRSSWMAPLERFLHRRMRVITGNSQKVVQQLLEDEGVARDKLHLIYNGVDFSRFNAEIDRNVVRAEFSVSSTTLILVIVANLIPYKGHQDLLQALALIKTRMPDWQLWCVGHDAGILGELQGLSKQLELQEHIQWLGQRRDIPNLLAAADIGLLCSHEEGFSNAILEGMAAGLPMIVTDVGGNAEAVIDQETGLVVPPKKPAALAQAILKLALDTTIRAEMVARSRLRAKTHFSMEACIHSYENLYQSVFQNSEINNGLAHTKNQK